MAGLKKSSVKKVSDRAQKEREAKKLEEEKEEAKKQELLRKRKSQNKTMLDAMFPIYGVVCAVLSLVYTQVGFFSLGSLILGCLGFYRTKDSKGRFFFISIVDILIGVVTGILFIMYVVGIIKVA